jgi:hypothetical protein
VTKDEDFGLQWPGYSPPDEPEQLAHRVDYQPIRVMPSAVEFPVGTALREARVALGPEPMAEELKPFLEDVALENEFQSKYGRGWNTWRGLVGSLAGSSDGRRTAATNPTEVATNRAGARSCLTLGPCNASHRRPARGDNIVPQRTPDCASHQTPHTPPSF